MLLLSLALAFQADPAIAAHTSPAYRACMADAVQTLALSRCVARELADQDARLNRTYRSAMARLGAAGRARLRASERQWLAARDRRCARVHASAGGGTIGPILLGQCRLKETVARNRWLERYRG
jgi:uncharacterized protein YecT (DUF1311 family)